MTGYIVHDLSMLVILLVFCEHETHSIAIRQGILLGIIICLQASYETLYHSYLSTNKAESLDSSSGDRTQEVMQAILQVESSKRACVIM